MVATPRRRPAQQATVPVFYPPLSDDARQWNVPAEIYRVGESKAWIEQQLRAEADAEASIKRQADDSLAEEFQTIKQGMGQLGSLREQIDVLEQTVASYQAADVARQQELIAVRSAADEAIGIGTNAVATTRDLSLATTSAADLLDRLRTTAEDLEGRLERAFADYTIKVVQLEKLAEDQKQTVSANQRAFQVVAAKLEGQIAALDQKVEQVSVTAQNARIDAMAAERVNRSGSDIQKAADEAAVMALRQWEESSDTAQMRKLIGTDARSLDHLSGALQSMKNKGKDLGGTTVQDATEIALRLIDRIRQAQDFGDGYGMETAREPDFPNGHGGAAKSAAAAGQGPTRPVR